MTNYYKILGLSLNDSQRTIYKTFVKKAFPLHPKNPNRKISDKYRFLTLSEAYFVLGDMDQRASYDLIYRNKYESREIEFSKEEIKSLLEQWERIGNQYAHEYYQMTFKDFKKAIPNAKNLLERAVYLILAIFEAS